MPEAAYGTTSREHVVRLMSDIDSTLGEVFLVLRLGAKLRAQDRERMARRLAGVVGSVETLRIWLSAGGR